MYTFGRRIRWGFTGFCGQKEVVFILVIASDPFPTILFGNFNHIENCACKFFFRIKIKGKRKIEAILLSFYHFC